MPYRAVMGRGQETHAPARVIPIAGPATVVLALPSGDDALVEALTAACPNATVWLVEAGSARESQVGRFALERGTPVVQRVPQGWLLAAPDHRSAPGRVAFLARAVPFRADEIERVARLVLLSGPVVAPRIPA
jgi:hypothetical protein